MTEKLPTSTRSPPTALAVGGDAPGGSGAQAASIAAATAELSNRPDMMIDRLHGGQFGEHVGRA
jgi:hypothetical protein